MLLPRGVGEMIVAANDVSHAHVVIVDHHRQHVGRVAVGAQQHQVVQVLVLPDHAALHLILDHGLAGQRRLEPDHRRDAGGRFGRIAVAPQAVVEAGTALGACLLAHRGHFLQRRIAAIGLAFGKQLLGDLAVARGAAELVDDVAVPIEPEPVEPVEDGVDRRLGRAFAVGVLDPQQHLATTAACIEPVEQRGARASNMEEAGGRRGKARNDGFVHDAGSEDAGVRASEAKGV